MLIIELSTNFIVSVHVLLTFTDRDLFQGPYEQVQTEFPWVNFVMEDLSQNNQVLGCIDPFGQLKQTLAIPLKYELR